MKIWRGTVSRREANLEQNTAATGNRLVIEGGVALPNSCSQSSGLPLSSIQI